ncbi:hypothetical protein CCH79_00001554 [Gambusia affinis]|uniref:KH domain-containing, RNA-binding, signal transduction-associated protein 2 n=1 Tax=Gambusia affinis TaxID=33528 RepID=A0A315VQJ7_GAMAF|nr:hypothetical protein CCH79_00001554 [Gambusia affinis]
MHPNKCLPELMAEKNSLDPSFVHAVRLLAEAKMLAIVMKKNVEIGKYEGDELKKDADTKKYLDIISNKNIKLSERVLIPIQQYPKFNFVGKLLGPRGNSMKRLQEETGVKMSILGKGSMRDKEKEEELRKSGEAKYAHLCNDLHVLIEVFAPPGEAYSRMSHALEEIKKFLVPDYNDEIRQEQLRELSLLNGSDESSRGRSIQGRSLRTTTTASTIHNVACCKIQCSYGHSGAQQDVVNEVHFNKKTQSVHLHVRCYLEEDVPEGRKVFYPIYGRTLKGPGRCKQKSSNTTRDCLSHTQQTSQNCSDEGLASSKGQESSSKLRIQAPTGYEDGYDEEYEDETYEAYDENYCTQTKSISEYYEHGHGTSDESYNSYEEEWTSPRPILKAPALRLTRGGYRKHPYGHKEDTFKMEESLHTFSSSSEEKILGQSETEADFGGQSNVRHDGRSTDSSVELFVMTCLLKKKNLTSKSELQRLLQREANAFEEETVLHSASVAEMVLVSERLILNQTEIVNAQRFLSENWCMFASYR